MAKLLPEQKIYSLAMQVVLTILLNLTFAVSAMAYERAVSGTEAIAATPPAAPAQTKSVRETRVVSVDAGVGYSNGLAKFAAAGYHVTPDWVIEGYYERASTVFFGHSVTRAIRSKNFWSPVVYTNLALLHRQTYGENQFLDLMTSAFTGKDTKYEVKYWDVGPEFSVGSQWNWGGFHVGIDWIGVYWPMYTSQADIKLTEDSAVSKKSTSSLKPDPSARLFRLHFGFSI